MKKRKLYIPPLSIFYTMKWVIEKENFLHTTKKERNQLVGYPLPAVCSNIMKIKKISVADLDPGSGIRCF
jgi:hypothetical protein